MFCKKCGSKILEGQAFCGNCGASVKEGKNSQNFSLQSQGRIVMHCPRCGNTKLQVQANNRVTSSISYRRVIGKKHAISNTAYNSLAETFWFCPSCGMKFRDLDELWQMYLRSKRAAKVYKIFLFITVIIFILFGFIAKLNGDTGFIILKLMLLIYAFFLLIPMGFLCLWEANNAKNKEKEYNNLAPKIRRIEKNNIKHIY